ncbi:MAG: hypothetical protein QM691_06720 [Opitutaceae bacterium]
MPSHLGCASVAPAQPKEAALIYIEKAFRLEAAEGLGRYPRPELIGPLLTHLPAALQDAVRMGFLHSSRAKGRISTALKAAAQVRFASIDAAGDTATLLTFRVPRFGDAAPQLFEQGRMWDDGPSEDSTAFDLFGAAIRDVAERRENSVHFDEPLLRRLVSYDPLLKHGISRISLEMSAGDERPAIDQQVIATARELSRKTPAARRVRIAGRLDLMGASQGVLKLHLRPGQVVTALWSGVAPLEQYHEFFNREVVLEGSGVFRPSGSLLRLDADALVPATQQDEFFREMPNATPLRDYQHLARQRTGEGSAFARLHGSVPAEESDEEFLAALETLR